MKEEKIIWTMTEEQFNWIVKLINQETADHMLKNNEPVGMSLFDSFCVKKKNSNTYLCLQKTDGGLEVVAEVSDCRFCP
jgi:hypothetical protein